MPQYDDRVTTSAADPRSNGKPVIFYARRPTALVLPLAAITETGGILCLLNNAPIGWFICAAPVVALLVTGAVVRPSLEITRDGLLQKQYPFSSLVRWDVIDDVGLATAGSRLILAYRLTEGTPPPRRQPAAAMLRTAAQPFDGGFFADALAGSPESVLSTVQHYLRDVTARNGLRSAQR